MDKLNKDLFDDTNLQTDEGRIGGAVILPCASKICRTGVIFGQTGCTTYINCNPVDASLDLGY